MSRSNYIEHKPSDAVNGAVMPTTWLQFYAAKAESVRWEYGCDVADAEQVASTCCTEWLNWHKEAIRLGWIPSQPWINATRRDFPDWWQMRVCHDLPDAFDAMSKAGRSLLMTKAQLQEA